MASSRDGSKPQTLEDVMDYMHDNHIPFLQRYRVGSHFQRRSGGQGLVQFVEREHDDAPYSVKVRRASWTLPLTNAICSKTLSIALGAGRCVLGVA